MKGRVVVTGLGVVAPNATSIPEFSLALKEGKSGLRFFPSLEELNFRCCVGGMPMISEERPRDYLSSLQLRQLNSEAILYGCIAGKDAWDDANLPIANEKEPMWNAGIIFGAGNSSASKYREAIYQVDDQNVRRLASTTVVQIMSSGVSAYLGGMLGCGNQVTTNSSACITGTESILMGYDRIVAGRADVMLCGSTGDGGPYVWGGFDALRVTNSQWNHQPEQSSRPMSATAAGFVPGSGAGALVLESLEHATKRGATIYAELLGGAVNSGGQRGEGSMTAPNSESVQRCIHQAMKNSNISSSEVDYINGHLTATAKDAVEINNWKEALNCTSDQFPLINSTKSLIGHCLSGSGSIETVATLLQMKEQFVAPNRNCEDLHPAIAALISPEQIPVDHAVEKDIEVAMKASFGFGDVNACLIFKKNIR